MGMAGLNLEPHLSKSGKSFLFYSCTSDVIVISRNSQWGESCKKPLKPSSPGIQRFLNTVKPLMRVDFLFFLFGFYIDSLYRSTLTRGQLSFIKSPYPRSSLLIFYLIAFFAHQK